MENTSLDNPWAKEEISRKILKYFGINENVIYHNLWHEVKAVLRRKFIILKAYITRGENSKINYLSFCCRKLEKI